MAKSNRLIPKTKQSLFELFFLRVIILSFISMAILVLLAKLQMDNFYQSITVFAKSQTSIFSYSTMHLLDTLGYRQFVYQIDTYFDIILFVIFVVGALLVFLIIVLLILFQKLFVIRHIKNFEECLLMAKHGLISKISGDFLSKEMVELFNTSNEINKDTVVLVHKIAENAEERRTFEFDMKIASQIQTAILPKEILTFSENLSNLIDVRAKLWGDKIVSSNFYDYFMLSSTKFAFLLGSISREGLAGAFYMMTIKSIIKKACNHSDDSPADALDEINRILLSDSKADMFFSLVLCFFDTKRSVLSFSKAGNIELIYVPFSGNRAVTNTLSDNPVLGQSRDSVYSYNELFMMEKDMFVIIESKEKHLSADDLKINIRSICENPVDINSSHLCEKISQELRFDELSGNNSIMVLIKK